MEENYFEESREVLENCGLDELTKLKMMRDAKKQAKRSFFSQHEKWEQYEKDKGIEGKYSDEQIVRKLANYILRQRIGRGNGNKGGEGERGE